MRLLKASRLAEDVLDHYQPAIIRNIFSNKKTPLFMAKQLKESGRMTPEELNGMTKQTARHFLSLHGGDKAKVKADPEYQAQMRILNDYRKSLQAIIRGEEDEQR